MCGRFSGQRGPDWGNDAALGGYSRIGVYRVNIEITELSMYVFIMHINIEIVLQHKSNMI